MKSRIIFVVIMLMVATLVTGCVGNTTERMSKQEIKEYKVLDIFRGVAWLNRDYYLVDYQDGPHRGTVMIYGSKNIFSSIANESTLQIRTYTYGGEVEHQYTLFISDKTEIKILT